MEWRCLGGALDEALVEAAALACRWLGTDIVHIENLAPLHPQVALRLAEHGLRLVLSFHDFFAFCRRPHCSKSRTSDSAPTARISTLRPLPACRRRRGPR